MGLILFTHVPLLMDSYYHKVIILRSNSKTWVCLEEINKENCAGYKGRIMAVDKLITKSGLILL